MVQYNSDQSQHGSDGVKINEGDSNAKGSIHKGREEMRAPRGKQSIQRGTGKGTKDPSSARKKRPFFSKESINCHFVQEADCGEDEK